MKSAVEKEVEATGSRDITVSGDGTWQKRGFQSRNEVVTVIGVALNNKINKALDVQTLSTVCQVCSSYKGPSEGVEYEEGFFQS